jgi:tetratricopeptide (TPR) repeat protein
MSASVLRAGSLRRVVNPPLLLIFLFASPLHAQTLQDGDTLWKAGRYKEANEIYLGLATLHPENVEYRVRLGMLSLDYGYPDQAEGDFEKALEIKKDDPHALLGMAMAAAELYEGKAAELAHKALEADPKLVDAQALLARLALEDSNNTLASEEARKAIAMDPNCVQAKAVLASLDWLADKKDTPWDPHDARGYLTVGHFFMLNRRYEEAIAYYRKAIALDPNLYPARSELGINLMRLGQNDEAYRQLENCFDNGFKNLPTTNTLKLMSSYDRFTTFKTDSTILVLAKKEADLLHPYFQSEMERDIAAYEKKYRMKLTRPVQVEVYPDHEDFAVRTLGMPGLGALGVTFGYVVAMDSPSGRPPGSFHWASTMRHELSHVFTLTMTGSHVPRWFTEGLAVHEETAASPEWGDRLGLDEIAALKNHQLLPVTGLDRGFVHPVAPPQIVVSYFQAGKICDYIDEHWGWDTLLAMLHDYAANAETGDVIRKELKIEPAEFDKRFLAWLDPQVKTQVEHFDEWKEGMKTVHAALAKKDYDAVLRDGPRLRDDYPDYVEAGNLYEALARAYTEKGDQAAATRQLDRYVHIGGRDPETIKLLARQLVDAGRPKEAAEVLDRLNYIYPEDREMHQMLGGLWFDAGNAPGAIREFGAVLADKPLDPAQAHYDLARAYHLNHQTDRAKDEVLAALEIAPGFRPAQKLLLQLSANEASGTSHRK